MITVKHTINLVTEFDETHPSAQRFLNQFPESEQADFLARMFEGILVDEGFIEHVNAGNSYAILKIDN